MMVCIGTGCASMCSCVFLKIYLMDITYLLAFVLYTTLVQTDQLLHGLMGNLAQTFIVTTCALLMFVIPDVASCGFKLNVLTSKWIYLLCVRF